MLICAAADIHYPREGRDWYQALAGSMCDSGAEVLVLAGDIAVGEQQQYGKFLDLFADFGGPKLFVPGNHDLWSLSRHPDTPRRYDRALRSIAGAAGFHYLPGAPLQLGDVGFVGGAGWYDYSFRQVEAPAADLRLASFHAGRGGAGAGIAALGTGGAKAWEELTDDDYARKALAWRGGGATRNVVWNDAMYINWGEADAGVVARMAADIVRDAAAMPQARALVGVCHFLPFAELLDPEPTDDVGSAYCRAYLGSALLGEAFLSDPRFRLVLCGHSHRQRVLETGHLAVANCSVGERSGGPLLFTLPDGETR